MEVLAFIRLTTMNEQRTWFDDEVNDSDEGESVEHDGWLEVSLRPDKTDRDDYTIVDEQDKSLSVWSRWLSSISSVFAVTASVQSPWESRRSSRQAEEDTSMWTKTRVSLIRKDWQHWWMKTLFDHSLSVGSFSITSAEEYSQWKSQRHPVQHVSVSRNSKEEKFLLIFSWW